MSRKLKIRYAGALLAFLFLGKKENIRTKNGQKC